MTKARPRHDTAPGGRGEDAVAEVREAVQRWFRAGHRDLPWRRTHDPYAIWLSETMLQQTRVETVIPYYGRFLARFPTLADLAAADRDEVLALWSGLGYYRRAVSLHDAVREVAERYGGEVPCDEEALLALKGVGRYTAGAIRSLAFGAEAPILDGNVARVLARVFRVEDAAGRGRARLWGLAAALVRGSSPADLNQGLMELGATVCVPRQPLCGACPVRARCEAHEHDEVDRFPARPPRRAVPTVRLDMALIAGRDGILLVERPQGGLWGGLWDLPSLELTGRVTRARLAEGWSRALPDLRLDVRRRLVRRTHVLTHRRLDVHAWEVVSCAGGCPAGPSDVGVLRRRWLGATEDPGGTSTLVREILSEVRDAPARGGEDRRGGEVAARGAGRGAGRGRWHR